MTTFPARQPVGEGVKVFPALGRHAPRDGFGEFVAARSTVLLRTAWLLTGDRGRAEDLLQEALATAWRAWPRIRRQDHPEVYVRRVMVNASLDARRRRWTGETPTATLPEPVAPDPAEAVDVREPVRAALATLTPHQRAVVVLRFYEDLTEAQTAALLGCSVGTVKSQTSRALARLRACQQLTGLVVPTPAPDRPTTWKEPSR